MIPDEFKYLENREIYTLIPLITLAAMLIIKFSGLLLFLLMWKLPEPAELFKDQLLILKALFCLSQPSPAWPYKAPCPISARIRLVADVNQVLLELKIAFSLKCFKS